VKWIEEETLPFKFPSAMCSLVLLYYSLLDKLEIYMPHPFVTSCLG